MFKKKKYLLCILLLLNISYLISCASIHSKDPAVRIKALNSFKDQDMLANVALEDEDDSVRCKATSKLTNQNLLARLALEDKNSTIRREAIRRLSDQNLLARIALEDKDWEIRPVAVERLTDESLLSKVALEAQNGNSAGYEAVSKIQAGDLLGTIAVKAKDYNVRNDAVKKLTDQNLLFKIALEDEDYNVRCQAVSRLVNDDLLFKIALNENENSLIRMTAADKLTDDNMLFKIALTIRDDSFCKASEKIVPKLALIADYNNHKQLLAKLAYEAESRDVRYQAVLNITDQNLLTKIVLEEQDKIICQDVVSRGMITDQKLLTEIVFKSRNRDIRRAAVGKLTDQKLITKIALEDKDNVVRCDAVRQISDRNILTKILIEERNDEVRYCAFEELYPSLCEVTEENALKLLGKVALKDKCGYIRREAVRLLEDQDILSEIFLKDKDKDVHLEAVYRLKDQKLLSKIVLEDKVWNIRKIAFNRLESDSLRDILNKAKDPALKIAVKIRLQETNWDKEIAKSAGRDNNLGNIIGAIALVNNPQPASDMVENICQKYISSEQVSLITELCSIFDEYGNSYLAVDFINSGKDELYDYAKKWAEKNGYEIKWVSKSERNNYHGSAILDK